MAYEYTTQGYTVNDSGRRLVVDPVTRIEGHLRCEVNINDDNVITNAVSCGTMFRGLEIIVKDRDPASVRARTHSPPSMPSRTRSKSTSPTTRTSSAT